MFPAMTKIVTPCVFFLIQGTTLATHINFLVSRFVSLIIVFQVFHSVDLFTISKNNAPLKRHSAIS